jgi:hypothetical protein
MKDASASGRSPRGDQACIRPGWRLLIPVVIGLSFANLARAAPGFTWQNGDTSCWAPSGACTLLVERAVGGSSLNAWWLVWKAEFDAGSAAARGSACSARDVTPPGGPRRAILEYCASDGARSERIEYPFEVLDGARASIELYGAAPGAAGIHRIGEVTLNGGVTGDYPPTAMVALVDDSGDRIRVHGAHLATIGLVKIAGARSLGASARGLLKRDADALECIGGPADAGGRAYLYAASGDLVDSVTISGSGMSPTDLPGSNDLVVWLDQDCSPPSTSIAEQVPTSSIGCAAIRDVLVGAEVGFVRPVFAEKISRRRSRNIIGERTLPIALSGIYRAVMGSETQARSVARDLRSISGVLAAWRMGDAVGWPASPNDPLYDQQWYLHNTPFVYCQSQVPVQDRNLQLSGSWGLPSYSGPDVGLLDSGHNIYDHVDVENLRAGYNFTTSMPGDIDGHATAMAGLIGAITDNQNGIAGVAPGVIIYGHKVCEDYNQGCPFLYGAWALDTTAQHTETMPVVVYPVSKANLGYDRTLSAAAKNAMLSGQLVVVPTGNDNQQQANPTPANVGEAVMAVGAVYMWDRRWDDFEINGQNGAGSNATKYIDVSAPGGRVIVAPNIHVSPLTNGYDTFLTGCSPVHIETMGAYGGTSAATALAGGTAALVFQTWEARPGFHERLVGEDLQRILELTADDVFAHGAGWDPQSGYGRINAHQALEATGPGSRLFHGVVGGEGTQGVLGNPDSSENLVQVEFKGVPGFASGTYPCRRYHWVGIGEWNIAGTSEPKAWTRASGTTGWRDTTVIDWALDVPWARIVPGSLVLNYMTVETYSYRVLDPSGNGQHLGWVPLGPDETQVAFTVLGVPGTVGVNDAEDGRPQLSRLWIAGGIGQHPTTICFAGAGGRAKLQILDVSGRVLWTRSLQTREREVHTVAWDGTGDDGQRCRSGVYFVRLSDESGATQSRKAVLVW